jgi:hypothetical protein
MSEQHQIETGSDSDAKLASASCSCGWSKFFGFARPTGEPVALRLAGAWAKLHEEGREPS